MLLHLVGAVPYLWAAQSFSDTEGQSEDVSEREVELNSGSVQISVTNLV
jgi:hypothetical protein